MQTAIVTGASGFIGCYIVKRLKQEGFSVRAVDRTLSPDLPKEAVDEYIIGDLTDASFCKEVIDKPFDRMYQLAANMGGAGFVFSGDNDADIMYTSGIINLNIANQATIAGVKRLFYSSSACVYPDQNPRDPNDPKCSEASAYPAAPGNEYGWEKLFSERLYQNFARNKGLQVRIARFHTTYGPGGTWKGGKEKFPAAICRKVVEAPEGGSVEVWGDGTQTRSFTYIDDCIEGMQRLMESDFTGPVNIGSEELTSINDLARMVISISGKKLSIKNVPGPVGVWGRNSDNELIKEKLGWEPKISLEEGMKKMYAWVEQQTENSIQQ